MSQSKSIKVYFVLGEESGDALGSELFDALKLKADAESKELSVVGLAGSRLKASGIESLFDIEDIAVMGFSAVIARLPTIVRRVYQTVGDIVEQKPDVIVLIDSPDFTHAVAKRVRKKLPNTAIINYVCPSVWAWRSSRAAKMRGYVDHVLALLPFEPEALKRLKGPEGTYIGHPLANKVAQLQPMPSPLPKTGPKKLLVLPGSRGSELKRMLQVYGDTLAVLKERGVEFEAVIPAVPHLKKRLEEQTADWSVKPEILDSADNAKTFSTAHAALATSGTVTLELALHRVPMVTAYRIDPIARLFSFLISAWTALLPNLIVDRVLVPEEHNEMVKPERMARYLERLLQDTPEREAQLAGFEDVAKAMKTKQPPSELAADVIFSYL